MAQFLDQFESYVRSREHRPAYLLDDKRISLGQVNVLANRFAHWLSNELGYGEAVVGICVEPSLETGGFVFGILKAGKAFLGLDPGYPPNRIRYMVEQSGCALVLTDGGVVNDVFGKARVVTTEEVITLMHNCSDSNPARETKDDLPAYVTFTSGSTGQPKAVLAPIRQVDNRFSWMWDTYPFDDDEVCCMRMPLSFVDTVWEILGPICKGIPVALISAKKFPGGEKLVELLACYRVSRIWMLPAAINALVELLPDLGDRLPQLQFWVCTGDALSPALAAKFYRTMPSATLFNLYGTSEVWDATWYEVRKDGIKGLFVPIGKAIQNVEIRIVDENCQALSAEKGGEIAVGGDGLALGYITISPRGVRPFVREVSGSEGQFYLTGDLGQINENGDILFFGRKEALVRRGKQLISLVEIEAALTLHPSVLEGAVGVTKSASGEPVVTGYYSVKEGGELSGEALTQFFRDHLNEGLVPDRLVLLRGFPMTPSGKINRRLLPEWEKQNSIEAAS